jgi:hypothetical protein
MLAFVDPEERIPPDHPIRAITALVDRALAELSSSFDARYTRATCTSHAPPDATAR